MKIGPSTRSERICDNLVLMADGKIIEVVEEGLPYFGYRVLTAPYEAGVGFPLPWDEVLVWRYDGVDVSELIEVKREDAIGKVMNCQGVLTGWMMPWFQSKRAD